LAPCLITDSAKRDLAVSGHDDFVVAADAEDGG